MAGGQPNHRMSMALYLCIAFGVAWTFWLWGWAVTNGIVSGPPLLALFIIGAFGPFFGVLAATLWDGGFSNMVRFFRRALKVRIGWTNFLLAFCLMLCICILAATIGAFLRGHPGVPFTGTWHDVVPTYLFLFFLGGATNEEFGWAYLTDKTDLVARPVVATAIVGVIWSMWHLPLFFLRGPGLTQHYTPFLAFLIAVTAMRFLFSWAYRRSGRSIFSNLVFHNSLNFGISIVAVAPSPTSPSTIPYWLLAAITAAAAALLWLWNPSRNEQRDPGMMAYLDQTP